MSFSLPWRGRIAAALFAASVAGCTSQPPPQDIDLLLHNGKIAVVDDAFSIHQALAVNDGKVVAVGGPDLTTRYRAARTIDLQGRTVVPGFNDTHIHLEGHARRHVNLAEVKSMTELKKLVADKAAEMGPGEWITGSAWSEDNLVEKRRPLRADLDEAAPQNPVILTRAGSHSAVANSRALQLARITRNTPNPEGGVIERDERGELNGVIRERQGMVENLVPPATDEELRASLIQNIRNILSLGITSFTLAGIPPADYEKWESIYREHGGQLPRATVQIRWITPQGRGSDDVKWGGAAAMKAFGKKTGDGNDRLKVGAVKISVDGGFTGPAAYTLEPYKGQPNYRGYLNYTEAELYDVIKTGHDLGWQMGLHAIGDGAIKLTVELLERAVNESPRQNHRHYLNHFTLPPPEETFRKMVENSIAITTQPNFTYTLDGRYVANLDGYRLEHNNPLRTPLKHGIFMALSADVLPIGPMVGLYAAVARKGMSGRVFAADEALTMQEAIRGYTRNGAWLTFEENTKGTLEPGKAADLVVLAEDILTIDPERVKDVKVEMTVVGGAVLYQRAAQGTQ